MKLNKKFNLLLITSAIFLIASACSKPNHEETINKKDRQSYRSDI